MDARAPAALSRLLLLGAALAAACGSPGASPVPPRTGGPAPAEWLPAAWSPPPRTYLVWVVRTQDCLSCQEVDYEFRRVQARWGARVPLLVVHVGRGRNETVPRAFLQSRRVQAGFLTFSRREFDRRFGGAAVPAIHLVDGGMIVWSSADRRAAGRAPASLEAVVARYRE